VRKKREGDKGSSPTNGQQKKKKDQEKGKNSLKGGKIEGGKKAERGEGGGVSLCINEKEIENMEGGWGGGGGEDGRCENLRKSLCITMTLLGLWGTIKFQRQKKKRERIITSFKLESLNSILSRSKVRQER